MDNTYTSTVVPYSSSRLYEQLKSAALRQIVHGCDGPVTRFVAISRAVNLAREDAGVLFPYVVGQGCPIANALDEALGSIPLDDGAVTAPGS